MKNAMRVCIFSFFLAVMLLVPALSWGAPSTILEFPYLYKSPRAMGMGGAYTAVGGRTDTLFYNPAGLSAMPVDDWEVNLINVSIEAGRNSQGIYNDVHDALKNGTSTEKLDNVIRVLGKHTGENMHLRAADWSSVGNNWGGVAFGAGALASLTVDTKIHQGFGEEGYAEMHANATAGGVGGVSMRVHKGLFVGVGLKYLYTTEVVHNFSARDIVENEENLSNYITKDLRHTGTAIGVDAGALWRPLEQSRLRPSFGLSVLNIGDTDFTHDAGRLPMTVNVGAAIRPRVPIVSGVTLAADYVDLLNNYGTDNDPGKRIRVGGEVQLFNKELAAMALRGGVYEGYWTAGAEFRLFVVDLSAVTYAEELGAYAGQEKDRRYLLTMDIGW